MNWLSYASWIAGPLLQITLLIFMVRRSYNVAFPRFFSYILFQILKSACLFVLYRYFPDSYFDAYWTGNAISVILAVAVMDEILLSLFKEYGGMQSLGTTIFRWSCGLLLLVACLGALSSGEVGGDRIVAAVFAFDRSMRLMQVGLFLLLILLSRFLKNSWRQPVFGIALGFGVFASVELILVSVVMRFGDGQGALISLLKSTVEATGTAYTNDLALAAGWDPDAGFMLRVEQAVDRVLSRSDWPRPSTSGTRIVSRKPNPEEGN